MNTCKITMIETYITERWSINKYQIYNTIRQTGFNQYLHKHLRTVYLSIRRLPNHYIPAHRSTGRQVTTNSRKVEWSYSQNKTFERTIFQAVMHAWGTDWLLFI